MKKFNAFTLAEVLITLGIIGVVAAMTMPTLINQTNGAQYRAAFKKELSVISQAVTLNEALEDWNFSDLDNSTNKLSKMLEERTNVVGKYGDGEASTLPEDYKPDWKSSDFDLDDVEEDVSTAGSGETKYYSFNDGSMFVFSDTASINCTNPDTGTPKICYGYFDVNGFKGPNKVTTCDNASASTDSECYVKIPKDIFPVIFYDHIILPGSKAGRAVLSDKTKQTTASTP